MRMMAGLAAILASALQPAAAVAQAQPGLTVGFERSLRFGQFAILGSGSRSLGADGTVSDLGLLSVGRDGAQTARFTIEYQRRAGAGTTGAVVVQVVVNAPAQIVTRALKGRIARFDVSGHGPIRPGEPFEVTLSNCAGTRCSDSFDLGATLEIAGQGDGSALPIPLAITVRFISEQ